MQLCRICNGANGSAFVEGECFICGGAAEKSGMMVEKAAMLLKDAGAKTFSISTVIDKEWLAREERVWDGRLAGAQSIKNHINRMVSESLEAKTGAGYCAEGDCRIVFGFSDGSVELRHSDLFIFGRYRKLSAGLSQSRWRCAKCEGSGCTQCDGKGKHYESVEERIGEPLKKAAQAQDYVLHASGREDVDATNSAGRPFVMELKEARARDLDLEALGREIAAGGEVEALGMRIVPRSFVEIVTESHFDKTYEAEVELSHDVDDAGISIISSLEGKTILQQTPKRVAHRRANLIRHRKVKHIEARRISEGDRRHIMLTIRAEAGTYIKELISGDGGRTNPNISGLLGTGAVCTRLEVTEIDDGFLDSCLEAMRL